MSKVKIELPQALSDFLQSQVAAGLFNTIEDAAEDAVRRAAEDAWVRDEIKLQALRAALAEGLADIQAGRVHEIGIDEILAEARAARLAQR